MAGYTQAYAQTTLDANHPTTANGDHVAYSINGTSEATAVLARTAVGATGWAAATAAQPSIKANNAILTSAAAIGAGTVTHFAVYSASTAGVQKTDWTALTASRTVAINDTLQWAIGALQITMD
jgi:hypothetical protein